MFDWFKKKKTPEIKQRQRFMVGSFLDFQETQALKLSTTFACIKVIAESIGMLPIKIYEENDGVKALAKKHPLYNVLTYQPNPNDTIAEFKEKIMTDLLLHGNSYCKIIRIGLPKFYSFISLLTKSLSLLSFFFFFLSFASSQKYI